MLSLCVDYIHNLPQFVHLHVGANDFSLWLAVDVTCKYLYSNKGALSGSLTPVSGIPGMYSKHLRKTKPTLQMSFLQNKDQAI